MKSAARKLGEDPTLWFFATLAVLLVLFRSIVPTWYEGFDFDSDQAIVGLMAKHLSELRNFPLFYYGQNYMLGVEAWLAAPLFVIGHPSVFLLRLPLVAVNCSVAVALIAGLSRSVHMRPSLAFVAALPFVMPAPVVAGRLLDLYSNVEPLLYVLALWALRDRPFLFGALFGVAYLQREFTVFAVPALLAVKALDGTLLTRATLARLMRAAVAFAVVWIVVDVLKRHLNSYGPPAGGLQTGPLILQMRMLMLRLCVTPQALLSRFDSFFFDCLPDLLGLRRLPLTSLGVNSVNSTMPSGSIVIAWTLGIVAAVMLMFPGKARPRHDSAHRRASGAGLSVLVRHCPWGARSPPICASGAADSDHMLRVVCHPRTLARHDGDCRLRVCGLRCDQFSRQLERPPRVSDTSSAQQIQRAHRLPRRPTD